MSNAREVHGVQVVLSQIPHAQKIVESAEKLLPNAGQILNVMQQNEFEANKKKVAETDALRQARAEDSDRERLKHASEQQRRRQKKAKKEGHLDVFG